METRSSSSALIEPASPPIFSISWGAVIAGLAVGLGVHLLFMLMGAAAGLAVYGAGERPDGGTVSVAAAAWNSIGVLVSTLVGGYIAARACGLRRTSDGVLHAVAAWGATMLFYALLTTSVAGNALSGAYGMAAGTMSGHGSSVTELIASLERGDRAGATRLLQDRFGLSAEQASRLTDQGIGSNRGGSTTNRTENETALTEAARTASTASSWLTLVILLSLGASAGGGVWGAHSNVRRSQAGEDITRRRVVRRHTREGLPTAG